MKYKITALEEKTTAQGKAYKRMTIQSPEGEETEKVSMWSDFPEFSSFVEGSEVDGDISVKGDFKNLYPIKKQGAGGGMSKNMDRIVEKKAGLIAEFQDKKAHNIEEAQKRTAWMWAKYSACDLIAQKYFGSLLDEDEKTLQKINDIATKIYNMEPLTPFN